MNVSLGNAQVSGEFKVVLRNKQGNITKETPWNKNLLTDTFFSSGNPSNIYGVVGTGTVPPVVTDTKLSSLVGVASNTATNTGSASVTGDDVTGYTYTTSSKIMRWNLGAIIGNISEWGWSDTTNLSTYQLRVKNLIRDTEGNPTTISVTASDQLEIWWRLNKKWIPLSEMVDAVSTVLLNGVSTEVTCKNLNPTKYSAAGMYDGTIWPRILGGMHYKTLVTAGTVATAIINATSGDNLAFASPTAAAEQNQLSASWMSTLISPGVVKVSVSWSIPLLTGAANTPMQAIVLDDYGAPSVSTTAILVALTFAPQFIKGADKVMTVTLSYTVSRA